MTLEEMTPKELETELLRFFRKLPNRDQVALAEIAIEWADLHGKKQGG